MEVPEDITRVEPLLLVGAICAAGFGVGSCGLSVCEACDLDPAVQAAGRQQRAEAEVRPHRAEQSYS